jgi:hypothetical protein
MDPIRAQEQQLKRLQQQLQDMYEDRHKIDEARYTMFRRQKLAEIALAREALIRARYGCK